MKEGKHWVVGWKVTKCSHRFGPRQPAALAASRPLTNLKSQDHLLQESRPPTSRVKTTNLKSQVTALNQNITV